jgi:predicted hydrolase (HD superfamily)
MDRSAAYSILTKYIHNKNLLKHSLAAEAAMKGIYKFLYAEKSSYAKATEDTWGITGLLHDVDYEIAQETNQLNMHGLLIFSDDREPNSIPEDISHAIKSHNYEDTKIQPKSDMDWAIVCADQLTGLIVAGALVHPEKKLAPLTSDYVLKRFGEKSFARGAKREPIQLCEEKLGIPLKEFINIVLFAMQGIHNELGL